ncbi:hypothetical protein [Devosia sp. CN2-171]|uniref:hypothetical protein n=1 Tax=Devosia sp. CN2-171 TaxID=3400909 RepID=UPI003BF874D3
MSDGIGSGRAGPGRPAGSVNKVTGALKEAILLAAQSVGEDGEGKDGLEGYLRDIARNEKRSFVALLGRVLPMQVEASVERSKVTKEQRDAALAAAMRAYEADGQDR